MAQVLKRGGSHELIIRAARAHHCPICVQHSRHARRPLAATQLHAPMRCFAIDNFGWQHPRTKRMYRETCIICCFAHQPNPSSRFTRQENRVWEMENCSANEAVRALTLTWLPYSRRPKLVGTDPEGCFISRQWLNRVSEQRILASSQSGEVHRRTSTVARPIQTLKDGATRLSQQMKEAIPVDENFAWVTTAFSDVVSVHGHSSTSCCLVSA